MRVPPRLKMRLGVCNRRRTARYTAPTPLFNSVWWIGRPRMGSALKTPRISLPRHPFVGGSSVIFPILLFSLPRYGGATTAWPNCLMSALGQKRTSRHVRFMSALPPKADITGRQLDFRFVPIHPCSAVMRLAIAGTVFRGFLRTPKAFLGHCLTIVGSRQCAPPLNHEPAAC